MAPRSKLCGCVSHEALGTFISSVKSMPNPLRTALKRAHKDLPDFKISTGHIFKNGVIRTMADGDADATVEAIAIKSDSIIAAGTLSECREASPGATEIDLEGKCMLPGLIETHVHLLPAAIYKGWVTLSPFDGQDLVGEPYKLQWVYDTLSSALANGEVKNGWLLGSAVDPSMFSDMDPSKEWMDPTAEGLDKNVSKDVCIFLMNSSGHLGYANTAVLKEAGVDNPTGIVAEDEMETLIATAVRAISESNPNFVNEVLETLMGILQSAADLGVTTIFDALLGSLSSKAELDFFDELANSDECPQRLGGALWVDSEDKYKLWKETFGITPTTYKSDKFLVPFVKIISDGSNQGLTGYQHDPYPHPNPIINDGHESGLWYLEGVDHKKLMVDLVSDGWFLMVHAVVYPGRTGYSGCAVRPCRI